MKKAPWLVSVGIFLSSAVAYGQGDKDALPQWLTTKIVAQKNAKHPSEVEESRYNGAKIYEIIRTGSYDTGYEHVLLKEDGTEICRFGGYTPHVTNGSCDIGNIKYVRTIFKPEAYKP